MLKIGETMNLCLCVPAIVGDLWVWEEKGIQLRRHPCTRVMFSVGPFTLGRGVGLVGHSLGLITKPQN